LLKSPVSSTEANIWGEAFKVNCEIKHCNMTADIRDTVFCQQEIQKLLPWYGKRHNFSAEYVER